MAPLILASALAAAALYGCASVGPAAAPGGSVAPSPGAQARASSAPRYRCDQGIDVTVQLTEDTAVVDAGTLGNDVLLRDAGGATPQQTVYSNPRMRAEFGLGVNGRDAILRYASPPRALHCLRE